MVRDRRDGTVSLGEAEDLSTAQHSTAHGAAAAAAAAAAAQLGPSSASAHAAHRAAQPQRHHSDVSLREPSVSIAAIAGSDRVAL